MFFSVVIPSHKRKTMLKDLLNSLSRQSFKDFEVVVVATENDAAFSLKNDPYDFPIRFEYVPNDPSAGQSASIKRNHGAQLAKGEWLAFTDDDCTSKENWLFEAHQKIKDENLDFLEGCVEIPAPEKMTFPYKGIKRLSKAGGYQTCNMFYKKSDFLKLGGFDLNFPYYLEDTDLAWTFLEHGKKVSFAEKAVVSHPVPEPAPKKMLESAWRLEKLPYLLKKHPNLFKASNMRALPRPHFLLLIADLLILLSLFFSEKLFLIFLTARLLITLLILLRMLSGCRFNMSEFFQMYYFLLICPAIGFYSLIKGNLQQGVWLFLR